MDFLDIKWKRLTRPIEMEFDTPKTLLEIFPEFKYETISIVEDNNIGEFREFVLRINGENIVIQGEEN